MIVRRAKSSPSGFSSDKFSQAVFSLSEYLRSMGDFEFAQYLETLLAQKERSESRNQ